LPEGLAQSDMLEQYSRVLVRKLEERSAQIEAANRELRRDNDARRRAEHEARAAEARLRMVFDNEPECVKVVAPGGELLEMNSAGLRLLEADDFDRVRGRPVIEAVHPEDRDTYRGLHLRACGGESGIARFRIIGLKGTERVLESHATPLRDGSGPVSAVLSITRDITSEMRAEAAERRANELLRAITDNIPEHVLVKDLELRYLYLNQHALDWLGNSRLGAIGKRLSDLIPADEAEPAEAQDREVLATGETVQREIVFRTATGSRTFLTTKAPFRDARGQIIGVIGLALDISARKRMEADLRKSVVGLGVRNRELQEFAFVASHDLQEPLRKIRIFADAMVQQHRAALPEEVADYLLRVHRAADRMQVLLDDLLSYSRIVRGGQRLADTDLGTVLAEVLADLDHQIRACGAECVVGHLPAIEADPGRMRQVFQNLISNALRFRRPDVPPRIGIDAEPCDLEGVAAVRVAVRDNGIGFDPEYSERIFAPFQRLHGQEDYPGTGIGLAIVRRIVEEHNGHAKASGKPGEGACFTVELPLQQPA
jgi:PAS domain S-box-containing protein